VYDTWTQASNDLTALVTQHRDEVKSALLKLLDLLKNTAGGILIFTLSIIISGVLLAYAKSAEILQDRCSSSWPAMLEIPWWNLLN
jgi:hypothetical protein